MKFIFRKHIDGGYSIYGYRRKVNNAKALSRSNGYFVKIKSHSKIGIHYRGDWRIKLVCGCTVDNDERGGIINKVKIDLIKKGGVSIQARNKKTGI